MKRRSAEAAVDKKAQGNYGIGLGWLKRDRVREAIVSFRRALEIEPTYLDPYLDLGKVLIHQRRWNDLIELCRQGLTYYIEVPELHKMLITALEERGSIGDAFAAYELTAADDRCPRLAQLEIVCCVVARNEIVRLPSFVDHYRALGVDRFFFIDNDSDDGTSEWLLEQPDVHLWCSPMSFKKANFGSSWFELLLRRYGIDHWALTVDADELLIYDGYPRRPLRAFCADLDRRGQRAASGLLLDMYGGGAVGETRLEPGGDLLQACPFFDREYCHTRHERGGHYANQTIFFGGPRQRVFPAEHDYLLSKVPLVRYRPDVVLTSGQHLTNLPFSRIAHEQVCLLHFKFIDSLLACAPLEAEREIHAMAGEQYKAYARVLASEATTSLYDPDCSVRFEGVAQLQELEIMSPEPAPELEVFPPIEPLDGAGERPFWSVMITLHDRLHNLEGVVGSVLQQAADDMQIEVVHDPTDDGLESELGRRLKALAGDRVELYCHAERLGHPSVFNLCVERSRGEWVHILHDDDRVEPGFYASLREGIGSAPEVGAAFSRFAIARDGEQEPVAWRSWVERETAGVIEDWLERIAVECRLQFSAMVVRRAVYEKVGGFCAQALSALDWEMWKRIAVAVPVWHVPEVLVTVGRDASAESMRLLPSGEQVEHALRTVDISRRYLPEHDADRLSQKAHERLCLYAVEVAEQSLERGDTAAALANLRAASLGCVSPRVNRALQQVLRGRDV